jgi:hypothetical protein
MAAVYLCDGCGCNVEHPKKVGHVIQRDYCEPCAVKAEDFLQAEELLRKVHAEQFIAARQAFINTAATGGFKLPDVP